MKKQAKRNFIPAFVSVALFFLIVFLPSVTLAQDCNDPSFAISNPACQNNETSDGLVGVIAKISDLFKAILPVLIAFGVLYFIWGVIQYMIADGEEAKTKGRDTIVYGIIGLAVIVSIWGLVAILGQTLGLESADAPDVSGLVAQGSTSACTAIGARTDFAGVLNYFTFIIGK